MAEQPVIDRPDPTWLEIKRWADDRLVVHRRALETQGLAHDDTEALRSAIVELEALLKFPNPSKIAANLSEESD